MSSIETTKETIKKKMKLLDYQSELPQTVNTTKPQEVQTPKHQKVKVTMYLTEEHWKMFNDLCLEEMKRSGKPEKSKILCDAIEHWYKQRINQT